jgi:hypothetical protein
MLSSYPKRRQRLRNEPVPSGRNWEFRIEHLSDPIRSFNAEQINSCVQAPSRARPRAAEFRAKTTIELPARSTKRASAGAHVVDSGTPPLFGHRQSARIPTHHQMSRGSSAPGSSSPPLGARRSEGDVLRLHSYARACYAPCAHADPGFRCPVQKNSLTKKRIPLQPRQVVLRQREHDLRCSVDHRALFESHRLHRRPKPYLVTCSSRTCRSFMSPTFGPSKM